MRSNSGKDESRNNLRDPTLRDQDKKPTTRPAGGAGPRTTELGSAARNSGQRGSGGEGGEPGGR